MLPSLPPSVGGRYSAMTAVQRDEMGAAPMLRTIGSCSADHARHFYVMAQTLLGWA